MKPARRPFIRSFRIRIALITTGLAVGVIAALFVASALAVVARRASILDRMMVAHLAGPGFSTRSPTVWPSIDAHLNASFSAFAPIESTENFAILRAVDDQAGQLYRSPNWPASLLVPEAADSELRTYYGGGTQWRIGQTRRGSVVVQLGVNTTLSEAQLKATIWRFGGAVILLCLAVGGVAWYLAGRAMRPIEHLSGVMERIRASDLRQRVAADEEVQEFERLVTVFNDMLDRLERSFLQSARFSGDAAHELRTPVSILQGELERAFERAGAYPELEQSLADMLDEVRRLDNVVRKLLMLSRADAGQLQIPLQALDLVPILRELADDLDMMAPERPLRLDLPARMDARGDADLLRQVLQNLVSNAVKYGVPEGWIAIAARRTGTGWQIDVANASAGIAFEQRDRLFDRFYRAGHAYDRRVAGVGLGLALAREIARAHGGELRLSDCTPAQLTFSLSLPADASDN
ncbi:cell wall metabolism sensor histidine kinase WalK [Duganella sp. Root336D2]|uniref:sensor histidine kinase n=1 Tax=Duganella sp. Root336D2 TaxID=1736518 RepID=UPI0006F24943|nr:ATP-binding protein [Duganella sp. Root336D2]KQV54086.1 histidine kinase [Duganella sp. Root336D2]